MIDGDDRSFEILVQGDRIGAKSPIFHHCVEGRGQVEADENVD